MKEIPVFEINLPDYKFKIFKDTSKKIPYPGTHVMEIMIPKIYYEQKPDFEKIGKKIDKILIDNFLNKQIAYRALSSQEHKDKSSDDIIDIIKKIGYDRYDPKRKGEKYENIEDKHIDFFALDFFIGENGEYTRHLLEPFYFWPTVEGKNPIKIDILIIYDFNKLEVVEHQYEGREGEIKRDGFIFKDKKNGKDAVLGIIKLK